MGEVSSDWVTPVEDGDGVADVTTHVSPMSRLMTMVEATDRCGNRRPRVERLVSAWNQGIRAEARSDEGADDPLIGTAAEPKNRPRTRLTDEEVGVMRSARAQGVSVVTLARQFGVHRGTVWAKTRWSPGKGAGVELIRSPSRRDSR
jgi:hypothetical protein